MPVRLHGSVSTRQLLSLITVTLQRSTQAGGSIYIIQAHHGEMPIKRNAYKAVLTLYIQIFCCLNAVNTNLLCVTAKVCVFRSRKELKNRSIEFRRHVPCSDIKLRKCVESIYNKRNGSMTRKRMRYNKLLFIK